MRDKRRIALILDEIERLWKSAPDIRYFQLISNLERMYEDEYEMKTDLFYLEDDDFLKWLKTINFKATEAVKE